MEIAGEEVDNVTTAGVEQLEPPVKSDNDNKNYRVIRLPNGLTALLISELGPEGEENVTKEDSEETAVGDNKEKASENVKSAASMTVGAGSFEDPEDLQGLAHFLEHMLFMGSEKYPGENEVEAFIMQNGGYLNATTSVEHSTYYFECQSQHLRKALDMIAQFFISPLLGEEALQRELQAVESEFKSKESSNFHRKNHLISSLAKKGHPARNFTGGNLKSLSSKITSKELKARLHEFHKLHYVATRMTVALQSRHSLDTLQSWVLEIFGEVPAGVKNPRNFDPDPFDTPEFNRFYKLNAIQDVQELEFTWAVPPVKEKSQLISQLYVEHLLKLSGKSSLKHFLREKLWAYAVNVWHDSSPLYVLVTLTIELLEEGLNNLQQVIEAVFSYLKILREKGPSVPIIEEIQGIIELRFKFEPKKRAINSVYALSQKMQHMSPRQYLQSEHVKGQYDLGEISNFLDQLTPGKVNIMLVKKENADTTFEHKEEWFGTPYNVEAFPPEWMTSWLEAPILDNFELPESNKYLTTDFTLLDCPEGEGPHPRRLACDERGELWFKQDTSFKLPEAFMNFALVSPLFNKSPTTTVLFDIYLGTLQEQLKSESDAADAVGLNFSIVISDGTTGNSLNVSLRGYNQKLPLLWEKVLQQMVKFDSEITEKKFLSIIEESKKKYYNSLLDTNILHSELQDAFKTTYFSIYDGINAISDITLDQLVEFSRTFRSRLFVYGLLQGNLTEQQARDVWEVTRQTLAYLPLLSNTWPQFRLYQPEVGSRVMRLASLNKESANSMVKHVFYCGPSENLHDRCAAQLIKSMMQEKVLTTLRTKEQLGYVVNCNSLAYRGVHYFTVTVQNQEDKHPVDHVDARIWAFLTSFQQHLSELTEKEVDDLKQSIINYLSIPFRSLLSEGLYNWGEICSGALLFDRRRLASEEFKQNINLEALKSWYERFIINLDTARHVSMQVQGHVAVLSSSESMIEVTTGEESKTEPSGESKSEGESKLEVKEESKTEEKSKSEEKGESKKEEESTSEENEKSKTEESKLEDMVDSNASPSGIKKCGPLSLQLLKVEGSISKPIIDLEEYTRSLYAYPMYHKTGK